MGKRRTAREFALQLLYQHAVRGEDAEALLAEFWAARPKIHADIRAFTEDLVRGTLAHLPAIDAALADLCRNWRLERLSLVDKSILRFAAYEIGFREDVPEKVTVDEAVEVAKRFGGEDSGAFVNGILDALIRNRERYFEAPPAPRA